MNSIRPHGLVNIQLIQLAPYNFSVCKWIVLQIKELSSLSMLLKMEAKNRLCSLYISVSQAITFNKYQCVFFRIFLAINLLWKAFPCCQIQHWPVSTLIKFNLSNLPPAYANHSSVLLLWCLTVLPEITQFPFLLELHEEFTVQPNWSSGPLAGLTTCCNCLLPHLEKTVLKNWL